MTAALADPPTTPPRPRRPRGDRLEYNRLRERAITAGTWVPRGNNIDRVLIDRVLAGTAVWGSLGNQAEREACVLAARDLLRASTGTTPNVWKIAEFLRCNRITIGRIVEALVAREGTLKMMDLGRRTQPATTSDGFMHDPRRACKGKALSVFHAPDKLRGSALQQHLITARAICATCPLKTRMECLEWALANHEYGIWAGTDNAERAAIRRTRAAAAKAAKKASKAVSP